MKNLFKVVVMLLIAQNYLIAKVHIPSFIMAPKNVVVDLDNSSCNSRCFDRLIQDKQYFTFIAKYKDASNYSKNRFKDDYKDISYKLNIAHKKDSIKIAILSPDNIGQYKQVLPNSIESYLLLREIDFRLKVFSIKSINEKTLKGKLDEIRDDGFRYIIAPLSIDEANLLVSLDTDNLLIYIPTVDSQSVQKYNKNIIFGGISYKNQISSLSKLSNKKITILSSRNILLKSINNQIKNIYEGNISFNGYIDSPSANFQMILEANTDINQSSIFLNTPIVLTSLILSQIRYYNLKPYVLLSTQINYSPSILNLTQYEDRKNLYIASSVGEYNTPLQEIGSLFGGDIKYDWVSYSASIGIDKIVNMHTQGDMKRLFLNDIRDNQVEYKTKIYKTGASKFSLIK